MKLLISTPFLEQGAKEGLQVLAKSDGDDGEICAEGEDWEQGKVVT